MVTGIRTSARLAALLMVGLVASLCVAGTVLADRYSVSGGPATSVVPGGLASYTGNLNYSTGITSNECTSQNAYAGEVTFCINNSQGAIHLGGATSSGSINWGYGNSQFQLNGPVYIAAGGLSLSAAVVATAGTLWNSQGQNLGGVSTSCTLSDASGAGLTFTASSCTYTPLGNQIVMDFTATYPSTASSANAGLGGLPYSSANAAYAQVPNVLSVTVGTSVLTVTPIKNTTTAGIYLAAGATAVTNATLSGASIAGRIIYPLQ